MDKFARLPKEEKKIYFETAAANSGVLSAYIIEKDFWVCWILKQIFTIPNLSGHIIFKGGTSLSKVFHVINRFSEDIDISVSKEILGMTDSQDPENAKNAKQRELRLEELSTACKTFVKKQLYNELNASIRSLLGTTEDWTLEVDPADEQTLLFNYPPATESKNDYIPRRVKIEIGARSDHWPAHDCKINSYLADEIPNVLEKREAIVKTLDAARTFWEKATILHAYAHYPESKTPEARQSRHYYDFYQLLSSKHKNEATQAIDLLTRVAKHKSIYFRAGWAKYDEAKPGTLKLIPQERVEEIMRKDYEQMEEMLFGGSPKWSEILKAIEEFERDFNSEQNWAGTSNEQ